MRLPFRSLFVRRWVRLTLPVITLALGALALGFLAWRESDRARRTAEILVQDYSTFVAGKFNDALLERYRTVVDHAPHEGHENEPSSLLPDLRERVGRIRSGESSALPPPNHSSVRYTFLYDVESDRLMLSGLGPGEAEKADLKRMLRLAVTQGAKCANLPEITFGRLEELAGVPSSGIEYSGIAYADQPGRISMLAGMRLDYSKAKEVFFDPVLEQSKYCPSLFLPESLASMSRNGEAASFLIRDPAGSVVVASEPRFEGVSAIRRPLHSFLPFPGWTLEVAVNPAMVQPLLPYRGQGFPWLVLVAPALLVAASAILAFRTIRRDNELYRLREGFISNVSHELKTPLSRIRLFNELLWSGKQSSQAKRNQYFRIIDRECRRLTSLVENILDFSRSDKGVRQYQNTSLDLVQIAEEAVETYRTGSDRRNIRLLTTAAPLLRGDPQAVYQAVANLIDNAVKYSPAGSPVTVRIVRSGAAIRLEVADRGCGIPPAAQQKIFEEYFRVDSGDTQTASGSGLGLTLVQRTIQAHGGRVDVASKVGEGSTFALTFPLGGGREPAPLAGRGEATI